MTILAFGRTLARTMIDAGAVTVDPASGFVWSSGLRAPLYCDHRLLTGRPDLRAPVSDALVDLVGRHFPDAEGIAGVAQAAIPWAAWVADKVGLPLLAVRRRPKRHGQQRQVEGGLETISNVVIVEDVLSTGSSVERVAAAIRDTGPEVLGAVTILDYEMSGDRLPRAGLELHSLYTYRDLRQELGADEPAADGLDVLDSWYAGLSQNERGPT